MAALRHPSQKAEQELVNTWLGDHQEIPEIQVLRRRQNVSQKEQWQTTVILLPKKKRDELGSGNLKTILIF